MARPEPHGSEDWPAPLEILNPDSNHPVVLICEHAANHIPARYERLGVEPAELERHIAYDIGAAAVTRALAGRLGAPAFLGTYSRLLVDLNRPFGVPSSMPVLSEATRIPGNEGLDEAELAFRRRTIFDPFHDAIAALLDRRVGQPSLIVTIHSFTPVFLGVARPWHVGILHDHQPAFARHFLDGLAADPALVVGENVPYVIERDSDYAIPVHASDRVLPGALIEIRNDLIRTPEGVDAWAARLAPILDDLSLTRRPAA